MRKTPPSKNPHNVFSNLEDYNTLAMQVLTGVRHHNSNSNSDLERLLLAPSLANKTRCYKHLPKLSFYSDLQLGDHLWSYKTMGQNHGQNKHTICYSLLICNSKNTIILSSSLDPHKSHIMSCLHSKNSPSTLFLRLDTFLTTHTPFSNS